MGNGKQLGFSATLALQGEAFSLTESFKGSGFEGRAEENGIIQRGTTLVQESSFLPHSGSCVGIAQYCGQGKCVLAASSLCSVKVVWWVERQ